MALICAVFACGEGLNPVAFTLPMDAGTDASDGGASAPASSSGGAKKKDASTDDEDEDDEDDDDDDTSKKDASAPKKSCPSTKLDAGLALDGCCRPNGTCGYKLATCVAPEALGEPASTATCVYKGKDDDDDNDDDDDDDNDDDRDDDDND